MPFSYNYFKLEIKEHFLKNFTPDLRILDVGPGCGTYGTLLSPPFTIDAVEIFKPYIEQYKLNTIYKNVFEGDIRAFDTTDYDYIILGDVLEHLTQEEALTLLKKIKLKKYLIAVPFMYPQGTCYNNVWETHLQPDLTEVSVQNIYNVRKLYSNNEYGYFVNY